MAKSDIEIDIHIGISDMIDIHGLLMKFTDSICDELCCDLDDSDDFCEKFIINRYKNEIESRKKMLDFYKRYREEKIRIIKDKK